MVRNSSWLLEWTTVGYLALLRHDRRVSGPPGVPEAPWHNVVLKNHDEVAGRLNRSQDSICPPWAIHPRTGIGLAAVDCILRATTPKAHILDAGPKLTRGSCRGCAWMDTEDCHLAKRNGFAMTGPITSPVTKTSYVGATLKITPLLSSLCKNRREEQKGTVADGSICKLGHYPGVANA